VPTIDYSWYSYSVLYGCETCSLKLRVLEKRVLRRLFGPKRDEVTGDWGKLHNGELNDLYCSLRTIRVIKSRRLRWVENAEL
jgi:hypothetical protein